MEQKVYNQVEFDAIWKRYADNIVREQKENGWEHPAVLIDPEQSKILFLVGRVAGEYGIRATAEISQLPGNQIRIIAYGTEALKTISELGPTEAQVEPDVDIVYFGVPKMPEFVWDIFQNDFVAYLKKLHQEL